MAGIKRDSADKWFSDCVRMRANWTCECCAKEFPEGSSRQALHCAHIEGRRKKRLRWEPLNAMALCAGCHRLYTENPLQFTSFVISKIGKQGHDILLELAREMFHTTMQLRKEIGAHYRKEYKKMAEKRSQGDTGRIDFVGYI